MRMLVAALAAACLASGAAGAGEVKIGMIGSTYSPGQIKAKVGDTLVFNNDDQTDHTVFVPTSGFGVNLGNQKPGDTTQLPLGKAGTFEVECVYHADMVAKVTVEK